MRYSPNGQHIVMERGQHDSDAPRRIEVCEAATGESLVTCPPGFNPRWLDDRTIVAESATGAPGSFSQGSFTVRYIPANRGQVDANGGAWAVSDLSETLLHQNGTTLPVVWAREPRLSASAKLAVRHPSTGQVGIVGITGYLGPCEDSRWSSETLVWWLGGRVWGRTTPDQPTVELTVPGRSCAKPVPLWTGSRLFVGLVLDEGELWVSEWGDLVARNGLGWRVGQSDGSGFDWDMRRDGGYLSVCYLDPLGKPVYVDLLLDQPTESMLRPPEPEPIPDTPFVVDPHGVVEDVAAWLFSPNQGPDVHLSPDGLIRFFCKSDERSGDGPDPQIGEWWDRRDGYIGHLEDASMGRRIYLGKPVSAEAIVKLFPDTHAAVWASLPLYRNWWRDGARVWLPQRCVSGYRLRYTTDFLFNTGEVHPNVLIEIRVDVGHGVIHGKPVRVRGAYISSPDHGKTWNAEVNYYNEPNGANAWIAGPFPDDQPHWMKR